MKEAENNGKFQFHFPGILEYFKNVEENLHGAAENESKLCLIAIQK